MKNRILAITLVVCMLACFIPSGIPAVAADFSMPENPVFLADGELYEFGAGAPNSITWSSVGDSLLLSDGGHAIGMGSGLSIVSAVDKYGVGYTTPVYVSDTIETYAFSDVASALLGDAESFDLTTITDYEASQAEGADSDEWMYVDGNTGAVYTEDGLSFFETADNAEYLQFQISVSEDGNYVAMLPYTPSAVTDVFLAPTHADSVTDIQYTDARFKIFTADESGETTANEVLSLEAGDYYLTFVQVSGASLALDGFKLFRIGDMADVVTDISLACNSDIVLEGAEVEITTDVLPSDLADAALVYYADNPDVVAVDANGNAKALSYGKTSVRVISANNPFVSDAVELSVASVADDYQFAGLAQTFAAEYEGMYDLKNTATTSAMLVNNYAGSELIGTSSLFTFVDMGTNCSYRTATPENGLYVFSVKNSATNTTADRNVVMKIQVSESGQFIPAMINMVDSTTAGADVYLAPLSAKDKTAAEYLILEVSNAGRPTDDSEFEKTSLAPKAINLPKGEYYLSFVKTNDDGDGEFRYLRIKNFSFYKVGEYIAPDSVDVYAQNGVLLKTGETTTLTASAVPAAPYIDITWSTSNASIATVDATGKVTAKGKGVATITATSTDGSGVFGATQILVDATPTYKYEFQDFVNDKGIGYMVSATAVATENYGGWAYFNYAGTPTLNAASFTWKNVIILGNYYAFKVNIKEAGTYAAEVISDTIINSPDADLYITPATINGKKATSNDAFQPKNKFVHVPWGGGSIGDVENMASGSNVTMDLDAGEYVLWIKKEASYDAKLYNGKAGYVNPETGKIESGYKDRYFLFDAVNLYKVEEETMEGSVATVDGAQIRTKNAQGLRFISTIDKALIESADVVSYGTLLLPTADLNGNTDNLVLGYEANGHKVAQVEAKKLYAENDTSITFTAVVTNIKPENYTRAISARAYAVLENGDVIYSDVTTSRSLYQVAKLIAANADATATEKAVAAEIIAAVDGE